MALALVLASVAGAVLGLVWQSAGMTEAESAETAPAAPTVEGEN